MTYLLTGIALGLAGGISPGPLQALVVTSTLERGFGAGWRIAIAPLLTDLPVIVVSIVALRAVPEDFVRVLGLFGGAIVVAMGIHTLWTARSTPSEEVAAAPGRADVARGMAVNFFSPHPWIFWITAAAPLTLSAWRQSPTSAVLFLVGFYSLLIGSKVALAGVVALARKRLSARWRYRLVVIGGLLLVAGGVLLAVQVWTGRL